MVLAISAIDHITRHFSTIIISSSRQQQRRLLLVVLLAKRHRVLNTYLGFPIYSGVYGCSLFIATVIQSMW